MQTISFKSEIGVNEGYNVNDNGEVTQGITSIGALLQKAAEDVFKKTGIYVSTVVNGPNRTVYSQEWGCPVGGEVTYTISGDANPAFTPSLDEYKQAVLMVMNEMKEQLKQTTVSVVFSTDKGPDFFYLNNEKALENALNEIDSQSEKNIKDMSLAEDVLL